MVPLKHQTWPFPHNVTPNLVSRQVLAFSKKLAAFSFSQFAGSKRQDVECLNSTVKVTNVLKEFNKVTLFVTYFT